VSADADLSLLAYADEGGVKLWNTQTRDLRTLKSSDSRLDLVALSPDGRDLVTGGRDAAFRWWDIRSGTNFLMGSETHRVLFSLDGKSLAAFQRGNTIQVWDVTNRLLRTNLVIEPAPGFAVAFSVDGRSLATTAGPT